MKTAIQKEMRTIRVQLKIHDITDKEKVSLRKKLANLKIIYEEEKIKTINKDVKNI